MALTIDTFTGERLGLRNSAVTRWYSGSSVILSAHILPCFSAHSFKDPFWCLLVREAAQAEAKFVIVGTMRLRTHSKNRA